RHLVTDCGFRLRVSYLCHLLTPLTSVLYRQQSPLADTPSPSGAVVAAPLSHINPIEMLETDYFISVDTINHHIHNSFLEYIYPTLVGKGITPGYVGNDRRKERPERFLVSREYLLSQPDIHIVDDLPRLLLRNLPDSEGLLVVIDVPNNPTRDLVHQIIGNRMNEPRIREGPVLHAVFSLAEFTSPTVQDATLWPFPMLE